MAADKNLCRPLAERVMLESPFATTHGVEVGDLQIVRFLVLAFLLSGCCVSAEKATMMTFHMLWTGAQSIDSV